MLIEAALVIPLLLTLTFGAIEVGMLFTTNGAVAGLTRSAARTMSSEYAAASANVVSANATGRDLVLQNLASKMSSEVRTLQFGEPEMMLVYKPVSGSADGGPPGDVSNPATYPCAGECVKYLWDEGTRTWTRTSGSWPNPDVCGPGTDDVGVYLSVNHDALTPILGGNRRVSAYTVMRFEPQPGEACQ